MINIEKKLHEEEEGEEGNEKGLVTGSSRAGINSSYG